MIVVRSLFALAAVVLLAGCATSVQPAAQPAPIEVAPVVAEEPPPQVVPAPQDAAPTHPEGRVIKVIKLPKGQTPYDLPKEEVSRCPPPARKPVYQPVCGTASDPCRLLFGCDDPCAGGRCSIPR